MKLIERLNEIGEQLDKEQLLYIFSFKNKNSFASLSIKEFIEQFYYNYRQLSTHYEITKTTQCAAYSWRSIGDVYRLVKYYYPKATFVEVFKAFAELLNEKRLYSSYCYDINKRVFTALDAAIYSDNSGSYSIKDEFGLTKKDYSNYIKTISKPKKA